MADSADFHRHCERTETGHHFYYQVLIGQSGELVDMRPYDTRIHHNTTVSWVFEAIADRVAWPRQFCQIVIGLRCFTYAHRARDREHTLLQDLRRELVQQETLHGADVLPITLVRIPPPHTFGNDLCICDFPGYGCCIVGRSDALRDICAFDLFHDRGCICCGNCACCRMGRCNHACCHEQVAGECAAIEAVASAEGGRGWRYPC